MFGNSQADGMDQASPDVCLTPADPLPPVPIPYPNLAQSSMAVKSVATVLFAGSPAHNLSTMIPLTSGDEAGVKGGVVSGTNMGASRHTKGADAVLVGGAPVTRLTSPTSQNNGNCTGVRVSPSQTTVLVLAP